MISIDTNLSNVIVAGVTSLFTFLGLVATVFIGYLTAKLNKMESVNKETHALVNSAMGSQLRLASALSSRIAKLTNDPDDIESAKDAERLYQEHVAKQAIADQNKSS